MNYDVETQVLLALLRAALWKTPPDVALFPLSPEAWQRVFRLAEEQTVTALAYDGLDCLPEAMLPPEDLVMRWLAATDRIVRHNRTMNTVLRRLCNAFWAEGLRPVLLKGQASAQCYRHPLLRQAGDIDLYFPHSGDAQRAEAWVRRQGVHVERESDGSIYYIWCGVKVEHHPRLLDLYNPRLQSLVQGAEVHEGFVVRPIGDDAFPVEIPAPALEMLMLSSHILKHAMGHGIGLRQLCDVACLCRSIPSASYGEAFHRLCRETGLERWQRLLHGCLRNDFRLSAADLPFPDASASSQALMRIVLRGGNFGQYASARSQAAVAPWHRKCRTATAFVRNLGFSLRYAPSEAFWMVAQLLRGQV